MFGLYIYEIIFPDETRKIETPIDRFDIHTLPNNSNKLLIMTSSSSSVLSVYIPRITLKMSGQKIKDTFRDMGLGNIERVDITPSPSPSQNSAYLHFNKWAATPASLELQARIRDPNQQARIVYSDPWYWVLLPNNKPLTAEQVADARKQAISDADLLASPPSRGATYADIIGAARPAPIIVDLVVNRAVGEISECDLIAMEEEVMACDDEYESGITERLNEELRVVITELQIRLAQVEAMAVNTAYKQEFAEENLAYLNRETTDQNIMVWEHDAAIGDMEEEMWGAEEEEDAEMEEVAEVVDYCLGCETGLDSDAQHRDPTTGCYFPNCCVAAELDEMDVDMME
jgi:hypothetical protein